MEQVSVFPRWKEDGCGHLIFAIVAGCCAWADYKLKLDGQRAGIMVVGGFFSVLAAVLGFWSLFHRGPSFTMTNDALVLHCSRLVIPWKDIKGIRTVSSSKKGGTPVLEGVILQIIQAPGQFRDHEMNFKGLDMPPETIIAQFQKRMGV